MMPAEFFGTATLQCLDETGEVVAEVAAVVVDGALRYVDPAAGLPECSTLRFLGADGQVLGEAPLCTDEERFMLALIDGLQLLH